MADNKTSWLIELVDKMTGPLKAVSAQFDKTHRNAQQLSEQMERTNVKASDLSSTLRNIAIGAGFALLTQQSMAFENSMAQSNTMLKQSKVDFAATTEQVRNLAETIPLAKDQLSNGLYEVLSAGVPKENAISFLEASAKSAVAGQAELGTVVRTTTTLIKAYGMEFDRATAIQNRMQKAVELGQTTMDELANALPKATVSASMLGVSVDELLGGFAAMTGPMGNASEVGTQLSAILGSMIKPSQEAAEMAAQLGVSFGANSIKESGGLAQYLDTLMPKIRAFSQSSGLAQEEIVARLFGREEGIRGILGLTGQLSDDWLRATQAMKDSAGSVQGAFNEMAGTGMSKMQMLRNSVTNAWDQIYAALAPAILWMAQAITSMVQWIRAFANEHPKLIQFIGLFLAIGGAVFALVRIFTLVKTAVMALNLVMMMNPIILIVTLIIAAVAAIIVYWDQLKGYFQAFWDWFLVATPIGWIIMAIMFVVKKIKENWEGLKLFFKAFWDWFMKYTPIGWLIQGIQFAIAKIKEAWGGLKQWFKDAWEWIKKYTGIQWIIDKIRELKAYIGMDSGSPVTSTEPTEEPATVTPEDNALQGFDPLAVTPPATMPGAPGATSPKSFEGGSGKSLIMNLNVTVNQTVSDIKQSAAQLREIVIATIVDASRDASNTVKG